MQVPLGAPLVAELPALDPPQAAYGARVEQPVTRAVVSYWRRAVLGEDGWTVTVESPVKRGSYVLVWRSGANAEVPEVFVPLFVGDVKPWPVGGEVEVSIPSPAGFPDDLTARIEVPVTREVVVAEQPAVRDLVKVVDDATVVRETVTLNSPDEGGEYLMCWRSVQRGYEAFVPVLVL
jgi:hypothetical protein